MNNNTENTLFGEQSHKRKNVRKKPRAQSSNILADKAKKSIDKLIAILEQKIDSSLYDPENADLKESLKLGAELAKVIPALLDASEKLNQSCAGKDKYDYISTLILEDDEAFEIAEKLLERLAKIKRK